MGATKFKGMYRIEKLLIVEDDTLLLEGLTYILEEVGFSVMAVQTMKNARDTIENIHFDLIVLDCNLPDGSGYDFCEELKLITSTKILILTARNTEVDELKAFKVGADEFIAKPFSTAILIERIRNLLKKTEQREYLLSNDVEVDLLEGTVHVNNTIVELTAKEYKLLCYFLKNKNVLLTKDMLVEYAWGADGKYTDDNNLFVRINRLRQKIEHNPKNPKRITTIHGMGYIWRED